MTDKVRGSDQLKLDCSSFSELTQEELLQVAGGGAYSTNIYLRPFPHGIPWPEWFSTLPGINPVINPGLAAGFNKPSF